MMSCKPQLLALLYIRCSSRTVLWEEQTRQVGGKKHVEGRLVGERATTDSRKRR